MQASRGVDDPPGVTLPRPLALQVLLKDRHSGGCVLALDVWHARLLGRRRQRGEEEEEERGVEEEERGQGEGEGQGRSTGS